MEYDVVTACSGTRSWSVVLPDTVRRRTVFVLPCSGRFDPRNVPPSGSLGDVWRWSASLYSVCVRTPGYRRRLQITCSLLCRLLKSCAGC